VKAYYWYVEAQRTKPVMRHKKFRFSGKLCDVSWNITEKDDVTIRQDILEFLDCLPKLRKKFTHRYFDTEQIRNILPFINFDHLKDLQATG